MPWIRYGSEEAFEFSNGASLNLSGSLKNLVASPLVGDLDAAFGSGFLGPFVRKSRWIKKRKFSYVSNVQQWRIRQLVASGLTDMGAPENSLKWSEQPAFKIWANAGSRHTFFDLPPCVVLHPRRQRPGRGLDEKKILQASL